MKISFTYQNPLRSKSRDPFFASIPKIPGVYFMRDAQGEILYVGKAKCLRSRLCSYRNAKPGSVGENVIEMLEFVFKIDWEEHPSERSALLRERELLRALNPPYNIADNWTEDYFFIGFQERENSLMEFRLTSRERDREELSLHGCYRHRRKAKSGYSALLRLLYACFSDKERFSFPSRLTRSAPAYRYSLRLPTAEPWSRLLGDFLSGRSSRLLSRIVELLLENERLPAFVRPGLQEDLEIAREFYLTCARANRRKLISQENMRKSIRESVAVARC